MISDTALWTTIICLGLGSFILRFTFIGFVGNRPMPDWLLRHLRYTAVAIIPALVAPIVVYSGPGGSPDPARLTAAIATVGISLWFKNTLLGILGGAGTLYAMLYLLG